MIFLATVWGALLDPLAIVGFVVAGLLPRKLWIALALASAWATAMEFMAYRLSNSLHLDYAFGEFLLARVVGGVLVTALVFGIAATVRAGWKSRVRS